MIYLVFYWSLLLISSVAELVHFWPAPSIFFTGFGSGSSSYKKEGFQTFKKKFRHHSFFLTRKMSFIFKYLFLNSLLSMWELTKRISLRTSSVLSKVEPEPDLNTGSDQKVPVATIVSDSHSSIPGQDPTMGLLLTVPTWPPLLFPQNWTVRNRALIRPKRLLLEQTGHF